MLKAFIKATCLFFLFIALSFIGYGQSFADKSYYLVDSLDLSKVSSSDKELIESSLKTYYQEKSDTGKLNAINVIVEASWDFYVWPKYNTFVWETSESLLAIENDAKTTRKLKRIKINAINNEGYLQEHSSNYQQAITHYKFALSLCEEVNDSTLMAILLNNLGSVNKRIGNSITAIKYYEQSLKIKKKLGDDKAAATTLNNLGVLYRNLGNVEGALSKYFESVEILDRAGEKKKVAVIKSNIGIIYLDQSDTTSGLKYLLESLKISQAINDIEGEAITRGNITSVYINRKNAKSAMRQLKRCLEIYNELDDKDGIASTKGRIGKLFLSLKEYDIAKQNFTEALTIYENIEAKKGVSSQSYQLGNLYYTLGNIDMAEMYGLKSFNAASELGFPSMMVNASSLLSKVYKDKKDWQKAFEFSELLIENKDSVNSLEIYKQTQLQQTNFQIKEHRKENELLKAKNELLTKHREVNQLQLQRSSFFLWFITVVITALTVVVILVLRALNKQRQISRLLRKQRNLSHSKEKQKESMLKEIHHRVKNNLQIVRSLLRLQSINADDPKLDHYFMEAQNRITSMALIHEKMYGSTNLNKLQSKEYFHNLVKGIVDSYTLSKKVNVKLDVHEFNLDLDTLVPLGLLINEVISNSMKYAFDGVEHPQISMQLHQLNNECYLEIQDNGVGFDVDGVLKGLGSDLIETFVGQLDGELEVATHAGTSYKISFPVLVGNKDLDE